MEIGAKLADAHPSDYNNTWNVWPVVRPTTVSRYSHSGQLFSHRGQLIFPVGSLINYIWTNIRNRIDENVRCLCNTEIKYYLFVEYGQQTFSHCFPG